ncbi:MAG: hypothetical protein WC523_04600 [Patescibacteria group bacterium]
MLPPDFGDTISEQEFKDFFALFLSGAGEMKNEKEMWVDCVEYGKITIEYPDGAPSFAVVRHYDLYSNVHLEWKDKFVDCKRHGVCEGYFLNGVVDWQETWNNGKRIK